MERQTDLLGEVIDYTLCGYLGELVCCDGTECDKCDDDDKYINKAVYEHRYGSQREVLQSKKHSGKKCRL